MSGQGFEIGWRLRMKRAMLRNPGAREGRTVAGRSIRLHEGVSIMKTIFVAACAALSFACAAPAAAQELPFTYGDYWEVSMIDVDDGAAATYIDHLATQWKKSQEFAKSKRWIKDYKVLANLHPRAGEPDFYLVTIFADMPNGTEAMRRDREYEAAMATTMRQAEEQSGTRARYRKLAGSQLMGELKLK
jgi:hypothetical protein